MPLFPRYFTPRTLAEPLPVAPETACGVLDHLWLQHGGLRSELVVGTDALGGLIGLSGAAREHLAEELRSELAYHEVSRRQQARCLAAEQVYFLNAQLLEQPAAAPGLDDSLYLYGTLFGPYPHAGPDPAPGWEGQLTLTRSDLLAGLVYAAADAFRYAEADAEGESLRGTFHALLPGDSQEAIDAGSGVILAYPLLPRELFRHDHGNELVIRQMLYDVLNALRDDAARESPAHFLREMILPVPSRPALEQELVANGYEIRGETACRRPGTKPGLAGFLTSVFGGLLAEQLPLPPEGSLQDYLQLARRVLDATPGFPSGRAMALQRRVVRGLAAPEAGRVPVTPRSGPVTPQPVGPRPTLSARVDPADWMQDFRTPRRSAQPPRLTSARGVARQQKRAASREDEAPLWMKDFAGPEDAKPEGEQAEPAAKLEWMSDFE